MLIELALLEKRANSEMLCKGSSRGKMFLTVLATDGDSIFINAILLQVVI